jgi:hypothetical protein
LAATLLELLKRVATKAAMTTMEATTGIIVEHFINFDCILFGS